MMFVLALFMALASSAANMTVTSLADDGSPGTLRYAIANANSGDTITFQLQNAQQNTQGTITLVQGQLEINKNLTIIGPGAANLSINGNNSTIVFKVDSGFSVLIAAVTITNGNSIANGNGGGRI